ncbi:hypothetical protein RA307_31690 [Xanthobacteraceae bacterium Astr-EGSB]|uniref:hypothetical protein n=1 Tax=Astrobacterium formosum TaxID=3069710 RepID=UPI0027B62006|nr:hypothetical protein [Xanthobacteraceae bacterium Astr-EGSB]
MTALAITAANVVWQSGPKAGDQVAGEAFDAGALIYKSPTTAKWLKAQCDGTAAEAGAEDLGMALATADGDGARITVALPDAIVAVGAGVAGIVYHPGATAGALVPTADLASTNKVTIAAIGIGSSKLKLARVYDAGAVLA